MRQLSWRSLPLAARRSSPAAPAAATSAPVVETPDGPWNYNRKHTDPSRLMHPPAGPRYRCSWIEGGFTVQSDGNITCGLDDPHSRRSFGNINRQSVAEIWENPEYDRLRLKLWEGYRCTECNLAQQVEDNAAGPPPGRPDRPTTLVVETTVRCNLRCDQPACIPNNDRAVQTRDGDFLDLDAFGRVADALEGNLSHVFFFNYGDPFVHVEAADMLGHIQRTNPDARVVTSTNGIPLSNPDRARRVVAAGALDFIMFTISGVTQESYARYHVGGRLDLALKGMENVIQAKRELGLSKPTVHWRYLVFRWNDSDAEIEAALAMAEAMGVDEFTLHLTHVPLTAISYRFSTGGPSFVRYRRYINNALGLTHYSPMPDDNGFYAVEQSGRYPVRWTGWQARKTVRVRKNKARLGLTTNRPGSDERPNHVFVVTPYETIKLRLKPGTWLSLALTVPPGVSIPNLDVEIVTFDHWYPAEDCGVDDPRCLGVLVLDRDADAEALPVWRKHEPLDATDEARLAGFRFEAPRRLIDW